MKLARRIVPSLAVIVAIVSATSAPVVAAALHPACAERSHHCAAPARVAACCCGHDAAQHDAAPVQSRVEVQADQSAVPALAGDIVAAIAPRLLPRVQSSPPHLSARDLPTLFAALLI